DLSSHWMGTPPSGTVVTWHTGTPATNANKVVNANAVVAGTYYAAYYDSYNDCYGSTSAQAVVVTINTCAPITNVCPSNTVNLTNHIDSTGKPSGTVVTWHTGTPATTGNHVTNPLAVNASGNYFAAYFDPTNMCFSNTVGPITVQINACPTCLATTAPTVSGNLLNNVCPNTTVDLNTIITSTAPSGTIVTWHTGTPATLANRVINPTDVGVGTYYAAHFDPVANCYSSSTSTAVGVVISACSGCPTTAPSLVTSSVVIPCPSTTTNLTLLPTGVIPSGLMVTWHTGTPATMANKVNDPSNVGVGTYYATYYDASLNCYSSSATGIVTVTQGTGISVSNICPTNTVDLSTHVDSTNKP
ncbi:MAG: hypothetical protein ACOVOV_06115, partial [Dolichospermum sp.]